MLSDIPGASRKDDRRRVVARRDDYVRWQAIFAPPKTSPEIARLLSQKINAALTDPDVREQFDRLFLKLEGSTPEKIAEQITRDIDLWRLFIRDNEIPRE